MCVLCFFLIGKESNISLIIITHYKRGEKKKNSHKFYQKPNGKLTVIGEFGRVKFVRASKKKLYITKTLTSVF